VTDKSFRDILAEFLDEATTSSAPNETQTSRPQAPVYEFPFTWQAPKTTAASVAKSAYPAPAPRPVKAKALPKPEFVLALAELSSADRANVECLIRLGATELSAGVSTARLKKAYRRLAKKLHPDVSPGTALQFMELKKAVAALNASGCGSESASGSKTPHPNAA
jgi:hypothetical protein